MPWWGWAIVVWIVLLALALVWNWQVHRLDDRFDEMFRNFRQRERDDDGRRG